MSRSAKKVIFVGAFPAAAALERYVSGDLALRLQSRGWQTRVTSRRQSRLARLVDALATVWRSRSDYEVACVDVFSGPAFVWAEAVCALLKRLAKPTALTLHGGNLPAFATRWPGRVRRLLETAAVVTAPSGYLQHYGGQYRAGIEIIPNGMDLGRYPYRERNCPQPKLVWLRAFHEIYNPVMAVQVVHALRRAYPGIELRMIGPDKGDGSLERTRAEADKLEVTAHVRFEGPVAKSAVPEALAASDIFLNTSNFDNTPVSVLEAMACGLFVVSTRVGGMSFLVEDGEDGLLVGAGEAELMADEAGRILSSTALARALSAAARRKAEGCDWNRVLPRWETLLKRVAQPTARPAAGPTPAAERSAELAAYEHAG